MFYGKNKLDMLYNNNGDDNHKRLLGKAGRLGQKVWTVSIISLIHPIIIFVVTT